MFTLTNAANAILEVGLQKLTPEEFGYRFQELVVQVIRSVDSMADLYDNKGAGQPDCYSLSAGFGFEIKARRASTVELDSNSWESLSKFNHSRLIAMVTEEAPYPLWVVNLEGAPRSPMALTDNVTIDRELEAHLKQGLSDLIEALGFERLCAPKRETVISSIAAVHRKLRS
jgi:hypothetical protein